MDGGRDRGGAPPRHAMNLKKILLAAILAGLTGTAWVLACGPYTTEMRTVQTIAPAHPDSYARGSVGVVRPRFARRYLVQAYRRFLDLPPLENAVPSTTPRGASSPPGGRLEEWLTFRRSVDAATADAPPEARTYLQVDRAIGSYQYIRNCLDDAFGAAVRTAKARSDTFGAASAQFRDWLRAQDAVFANCGDKALVLPDAAPPNADPLTVADRAYQTAAAYFYAMQLGEAAQRFRAIAADASSPWRPFGHYLAARALIRIGTIADPLETPSLAQAEGELQQVLADPAASALHESARGLQDFVLSHTRPVERVRDLGRMLTASGAVTDRQLEDYQWLMNRLLGDTTQYDYAGIPDREAIVQSAEVNDWIIAMQGSGDAARDRAIAQWRRSGTTPWLVAALWQIAPTHEDAARLLSAAAAVPRSSQAYATLAFLRARLLAARGETRAARDLLAALPTSPQPAFEAETVNLLAAERMRLASSMEELTANAARRIVSEAVDDIATPSSNPTPVFDADAREIFSQRLPLARLVEAVTQGKLPDRLKLHVASAAFTRALLLKRYDEAGRLVPALRALAPSLGADLTRFERASPADRQRAGLLLLLRTPGMRASVPGPEDDQTLAHKEPAREFDHMFRRNWWCGFAPKAGEFPTEPSELVSIVYGKDVPSPSFLTAADRAALDREFEALAAIGPAPNYLAAEAVKWGTSRPTDQDAAEALAHAVEGTRWGCADDRTSAASRRAFETLHRLFPSSEWAKKTKYWY
jgi:hypothetical protein